MRGLAVELRVLEHGHERPRHRPVLVDVTCHFDMTEAIATDAPETCVDYSDLQRIVLETAAETCFCLVERVAHEIARRVLELPHVLEATIAIRKPHKLPRCEEVGITLTLHA